MSKFLEIRVTPRAANNRITLDEDNKIKVYVTASPIDGQANQAVCELLARTLEVPKSSVLVAAGQTSRDKKIAFNTIDSQEALDRLKAKLQNKKLPGF